MKSMKTLTTFIFLILSISLLGLLTNCNASKKCEYTYWDDLSNYFKNEHHIDLISLDNTILYITPISDNCDNCIAINFDMLERLPQKKDFIPVLIGKTTEQNIERVNGIIKKSNLYFQDLNLEIFSYQTGFGKPLLVHIKDGNCLFFMEVKDQQIDEAYNYILKN